MKRLAAVFVPMEDQLTIHTHDNDANFHILRHLSLFCPLTPSVSVLQAALDGDPFISTFTAVRDTLDNNIITIE